MSKIAKTRAKRGVFWGVLAGGRWQTPFLEALSRLAQATFARTLPCTLQMIVNERGRKNRDPKRLKTPRTRGVGGTCHVAVRHFLALFFAKTFPPCFSLHLFSETVFVSYPSCPWSRRSGALGGGARGEYSRKEVKPAQNGLKQRQKQSNQTVKSIWRRSHSNYKETTPNNHVQTAKNG